MRLIFPSLLVLMLAACSGEPARLAIPPQTSELRIAASARSVEVAEISLPAYADAQEVALQGADGLIELVPGLLWADTPDRALTSTLVRNLGAITGADVAAEPWPLEELPQAELTVRVEEMLVTSEGILRLSGQYAIRRDTGRERLERFAIALPVETLELPDIARAYDAAWRQLSEQIAGRL